MNQKEISIFEIEEFSFGRKFGILGRLYHSVLAEKLQHIGITRHFSVLVLIDKMGNHCSQKFISDTLNIDKTMMVGVLDDLGSKGFIKRTQNPLDRREYWIQLTPKAKKHMPEVKATVNSLNKSVLKEFNDKEISDFHHRLDIIYKRLSVVKSNKVTSKAKSAALLIIAFLSISIFTVAQTKTTTADSTQSFTLDQCIVYAMQNQPALNQTLLNEAIVKTSNNISLSGWLPQINLSGNLIHYNQLPTTIVPNSFTPTGEPVTEKNGVSNTAIPELSASEAIFSPQLLYAIRSVHLYTEQASQIVDSTKIGIVSTVSKTFYNLLLTLEQIDVLKEDTARLQRNVIDTYHQYKGGIVDETDYQEAIITLNNSKAQLKQQVENIRPQYAALKQVMGFPPEKQFNVAYDTVKMNQEIAFDTTQALQYEKRIEYQQLQTQKGLQHQLTAYYRLSSLPTVSAFYNYYYEYESNSFSNLFNTAYPYSYIGLSVNIPLFTGFSHFENVHKSKLQEQMLDLDELSLKSEIYTEYTTAFANYKSNLYNWHLLKDNENQAKSVYKIVSMQYRQGIVAYLNMIVAESNLVSAEISYVNALFQVLTSKIDLEKAIGIIPVNSTTH